MKILLILLISAVTLAILVGAVQDLLRLRLIPRLLHSAAPEPAGPLVSIIIPARNEARSLAACLDGALSQTYEQLEVIVIDDHSTDATPAILAAYAASDQRLRVVQSQDLPPGWVGKPYACAQAAGLARGEWLLFLDADTQPAPGLVAALLAHAQHRALDVLTIFPLLQLVTFWERIILPSFVAMVVTIFRPERMLAADARPDEVFAIGPCILVRQRVYAATGGHAAPTVRGAVLEDVQLAQSLRAGGARIGLAAGLAFLRVRLYTSGREVFEGLAKNAFEGYRSGNGRSLGVVMRQIGMAFAPLWLLASGGVLLATSGGILAWAVFLHGLLATLVAYGSWAGQLIRLYRIPGVYALCWPLGILSYGLIAAYSFWRVRSGRGVIWKGRVYVGE